MRECRKEKFEQLNVLNSIADTMGSSNTTADGFKKLEDTIKNLNNTAHAEDVELMKEEDKVAKLNATIVNYVCNCTYNSWGNWGSCSKTCGNSGTKDRSRSVKWYPRNNGTDCIASDQKETSSCPGGCCRKYIGFLDRTVGYWYEFFCFPNLAVDCFWDQWGEWSTCPDPTECAISKMTRTREKNEHSCGGNMCSGLGNENKTCNRFDQVKTELNNLKLKVVELGGKLCQNVNCNNGGTCHEGECICTDAFSGSTCDVRGRW